MTKANERIKERLAELGLAFRADSTGENYIVKCRKCFLAAGEKRGKMVTLRYVTNYTAFHNCKVCGVSALRA